MWLPTENEMPNIRPLFLLSAALLGPACSSASEPAAPAEPALSAPAAAPEPLSPAPAAQPATTAIKPPPSQLEACGEIVVVAYRGSYQAPATVTRSKPEAAARATELLAQLKRGADFAELARKNRSAEQRARGARWHPLERIAVDQEALRPLSPRDRSSRRRRSKPTTSCDRAPCSSRSALASPPRRYKGRRRPTAISSARRPATAFSEACLAAWQGLRLRRVFRDCSNDASRIAARHGHVPRLARARLRSALSAEARRARAVIATDFGFHVIERPE